MDASAGEFFAVEDDPANELLRLYVEDDDIDIDIESEEDDEEEADDELETAESAAHCLHNEPWQTP